MWTRVKKISNKYWNKSSRTYYIHISCDQLTRCVIIITIKNNARLNINPDLVILYVLTLSVFTLLIFIQHYCYYIPFLKRLFYFDDVASRIPRLCLLIDDFCCFPELRSVRQEDWPEKSFNLKFSSCFSMAMF